jgi:hypothetical protein
MKKITRNSGSSKADLEFGYDASGNRLWKKVTPKGSGAVISTYYYLRDAQGNEMCRYVKYTNTTSQLMYVAQEHSIYGSSRVGVDNRKDTLYKAGNYSPSWGGISTSRRDLGSKSFELANHLGNVLVTLSDKPIYKVSSATIYFNPEITSISDYYPFGAPIQGRSFSSTEYRFEFNTQEKDDEISGTGNHNTATFWEYDSRLGRRWNTDPVVKPWESLYACLSDNPIIYTDHDGKDAIVSIHGNVVTVSTKIVLWGADATKDAVNKFQAEVNGTWNANKISYKDAKSGVEYQVKFDIRVELADGVEKVSSLPWGAYNPFNTNNYVEVNNTKLEARYADDGTSGVTSLGDEGLFGTSRPNFLKAVPHEIGHMLGLDHHYFSDLIVPGFDIVGDDPGWENNVMGCIDGNDGRTGAGDVDQRNINSIVSPAINEFNSVKDFAISHNKIRESMIKGGNRFIPPAKTVPTSYVTKIDNLKMDQ